MINDLMPSMFLFLSKSILEIFLYISVIALSFKAITALNIYIRKNS